MPFVVEKPEWSNEPDDEKSLMIFSAASTRVRRVTDRQTDGRTDMLQRHSIVRAVHSIAR